MELRVSVPANTLQIVDGRACPISGRLHPELSMRPLVRTKEVGAMRRILAILAVSTVALFPAVARADSMGGPGNDTIVGTFRVDYLSGGPGDDVILGKGGNDVLYAGRGHDIVNGGPGRDTCFVSPADTVTSCEVLATDAS